MKSNNLVVSPSIRRTQKPDLHVGQSQDENCNCYLVLRGLYLTSDGGEMKRSLLYSSYHLPLEEYLSGISLATVSIYFSQVGSIYEMSLYT